jgi:hypothetical protein
MELRQMGNKRRRNEKHNYTGLKTLSEDKLTETNTNTTKISGGNSNYLWPHNCSLLC